jgi:uncharacterized membrane protein
MEELQKQVTSQSGSEIKYQEALRQIDLLRQNQQNMRNENDQLKDELQRVMGRCAALESSKQREINELQMKLSSQLSSNS